MISKNIDDIKFDYFSKTPSYVRTILDMFPEEMVPTQTKMYIREAYNTILNNSDPSDIGDIISVSMEFGKKISEVSTVEASRFVAYVYESYIEKMICDISIFDKLNACVKLYSGSLSNEYESENVRIGHGR